MSVRRSSLARATARFDLAGSWVVCLASLLVVSSTARASDDAGVPLGRDVTRRHDVVAAVPRDAPEDLQSSGPRDFLCGVGRDCPQRASAVRQEGSWPIDEERVTVALEQVSRIDAVRKLADAAGWSVVVSGVDSDLVDVRVKHQPAARVLDRILAGKSYVATRDGNLISIFRARPDDVRSATSHRDATADEPLEKARRHAPDRLVTAGDVTVRADEVVGNLTVLAGNVEVYGTVQQDLAVFAGNVVLHPGARVLGDVNALAGSIDIDDAATISGNVSGLAGDISRGSVSHRRGPDQTDDDELDEDMREAQRDLSETQEEERAEAAELAAHPVLSRLEDAGDAVARSALLFAFGAVLLALAGGRVLRLEGEVSSRPLHALALGAAGLFVGVLALVAIAVTIIGIPLALSAGVLGAIGVYAGMCAALTALGRAALDARARLRDKPLELRSQSAYRHLAVGCALYLLASSLPRVGWLVTLAVVLIGFGALVSTRAAGLLARRAPSLTNEADTLPSEG